MEFEAVKKQRQTIYFICIDEMFLFRHTPVPLFESFKQTTNVQCLCMTTREKAYVACLANVFFVNYFKVGLLTS